MYLDHDESFKQFDWDDVVQFPVTDLPTVVSPMKPMQTIKEKALDKHKQQMKKEALEKHIKEETFEKRQCQFVTHDNFGYEAEQAMEETLAQQEVEQTNADEQQAAEDFAKEEQEPVVQEEEFAEEEQTEEDVPEEVSDFADEFEEENGGELSDVEGNGSEEGSEFADDIADSDYDVSDLDDDLKEDTVEEPVDVNIRAKADPIQDSDEEELQLPDSDDEAGAKYKFKGFTKEDLHDPQFRIGQVFQSPELFREAVRAYSCKNRFDNKMPVNDRKRISAKCQAHCPWNIWCSYDSRTNCMVIKRYNSEHKCSKKWKVKAFTSKFLA
ncbi:neurofilament medium polypeptide-like [Triticum aestivum]|uniref:neurofilament medium polypeptide-like n=1 Tax=Triticum aestivum TaxID=4565 RepID=UPI001D0312DD|nr:neurofilament medium polypeptide-like [Triticum aestivum]